MTNKKIQKDFYKDIIEVLETEGRADLVEFCEGRIAILDKKNANRSKKVNEENEAIKATILEVLATTEGTVTDIQKASDVLAPLSNQKVSAMLKQLVADNKVIKLTDGKKSFFSLHLYS